LLYNPDMKIPRYVSVVFSFIIVIAILILPLFIKTKSPVGTHPILFDHSAMLGKQPITIAFATTPSEHEQGTSGTKQLNFDQGMLFVFDSATMPAFWMKDMNYPLDIIWIDQDKKVIGVSENLDPKTYPKTYSPNGPIEYVLEVSAGFYKTNDIHIGDVLTF